ncbi:ChbG/HpnK family deacetylase [Bosea caraganae]|uniref:ChbG/HpnK family deacetylase n=1 Tax=Bosea caraganae TaxID=2763117 RepID=A0A370L420_9HYPH|nr:ChbG/HpnK family deacetylase [Bosea caraganae]RDJ23557.1 ChbG/HpnK family deacetylase [Bosea caraganae]RDJ24373.1 ChbG/HpnK family deacetylase [Bosea caraganae]
MVTRFVLCADDFALTEGVSRSILDLLALGKLSATGAMTNRPHWKRLAGELSAFSGRADLGLHLNLTCAAQLSPMPRIAPGGELPKLGDLARAAVSSAAARAEIAAEIERQLDAFEDALGRPPDFVDGHQHVHVLPGVRGAVLSAIRRRYREGSVYLRDPTDSVAAIRARNVAVGKALVIAGLALGLRSQALRRGIKVNSGFSGVSPFDPTRDFAADLGRFLLRPGPAHLVMCHPGHVDDELLGLDPVVATRPQEHLALKNFVPPDGLAIACFSALP